MNILLARRPIFGRNEQLVGYELRYQDDEASGTVDAGLDRSRHLVVDVFLGMGLDTVTGGKPAFIPTSRELLLSGYLELLDPERIVVMLTDVEPFDAAVRGACERLVTSGCRLALDEGVLAAGAQAEPLLDIAEIVRIDVAGQTGESVMRTIGQLEVHRVRLMAENVESRVVRDVCLSLGFELFNGYLFTQPEILAQRDAAIDYLATFRLLQRIRDPRVTDHEIEATFGLDVPLSYKLMRMANSAAVGARGVRSIGHAIRLLGREALYRWVAFLLVTASVERESQLEIARGSLLRARLCEQLAAPIGRPAAAGSLYVMGLLSHLDALLGRPMSGLILDMGLASEVEDALVGRAGFHGTVLRLVEAYEAFRWGEVMDACVELGIRPRVVGDLYIEAMTWTSEHVDALVEA